MNDRHLYVSDDGFFMTEREVFDLWKEFPPEFAVNLIVPLATDKDIRGKRPARYYRRLVASVATAGGRVLQHASLARDEALPCPPQPPAGRDYGS